MEKKPGFNKIWLIPIFLLALFLVFVAGAIWWVSSTLQRGLEQAQQAVQPAVDLSYSLSTQVSQVLHPTPTVLPDPVTIINSVRTLARLETIQYSVEKVITAETGQGIFGPLVGDKLLFVAHGEVIAGVDLEKLRPEDLWVDGGVLNLRLPAAEIFSANLDNEKSYVYDRQTGLLTWGDVNLETTARRAAETEILNAALQDGILDLAGQNAENYLARLVRELGYPDVIFVTPPATPVPTTAP